MRRSLFLILLTTGVAGAHPHIDGGPAFANKSGQLVTFGVSHGCAGKDTVKITVTIPDGISSVRGLYGPFGAPKVTRDGSNNVTSVTWEKATYEEGDSTYPQFTLRVRVADVPFTSIMFPVEQTCRDATGDTVVDWDQPDDTTGQAAPRLAVVPARVAGWNKLTLSAAVAADDIPLYFGDAQILWKGTAAYTPNAAVAALIAMTPGVSVLSGDLAAGDEIWVKY
jgi:periplasmic copper chaperone A